MPLPKTQLNSLITDGDWDADSVLIAILVALAYIMVMTAVAYFHDPSKGFDPSAFGTAVGTILGGGGVGYCAKRFGDRRNPGIGGDDGSTST